MHLHPLWLFNGLKRWITLKLLSVCCPNTWRCITLHGAWMYLHCTLRWIPYHRAYWLDKKKKNYQMWQLKPPVPPHIIALTQCTFACLCWQARPHQNTVMNFKSALLPPPRPIKKMRGKKKTLTHSLHPLFILALGLNFPRRHIELESDNWQKVWKI